MCSQYEVKIKPSEIVNHLLSSVHCDITEQDYNSHVYPFTPAPVIINQRDNNNLNLLLMNYSLIPSWSKTDKPKFATYNARLDRPDNNGNLEKIISAPTWRTPFKSQRCLVPLTGFFESCRSGSHMGNIVRFKQFSDELLFAAGIYDKWINPTTNQVIHSYAIITDEPTDFILSVGHDRQPVFLAPDQHSTWLNTKELPFNDAYDFLKAKQLTIDYSVNNVRELKPTTPTIQDSLF